MQRRAQAATERSHRSPGGPGITLDRLERSVKKDEIAYPHVTAGLNRAAAIVLSAANFGAFPMASGLF